MLRVLGREGVLLSTCNRTELYLVLEDGEDAGHVFRDLFGQLPTYCHVGDACARHLFRVCAGLDSAILGDVQIPRQVRAARRQATQAASLGPVLGELFDRALKLAARARAQTDISVGSASVGAAIADLVADRVNLGDSAVLLLGAGSTARKTAHQLRKRGVGRLLVSNRTLSRAQTLCERVSAEVVPWERRAAAVRDVDAVICATSADEPVLAVGDLRGLRLVVDAGMPRNVQAQDDVPHIDIDQVRSAREAGLERRRAAVPAVGVLIDDAVANWAAWRATRPLEDLLGRLYRDLEAEAALTAEALDTEPHVIALAMRRALHGHVHALRALYARSAVEA